MFARQIFSRSALLKAATIVGTTSASALILNQMSLMPSFTVSAEQESPLFVEWKKTFNIPSNLCTPVDNTNTKLVPEVTSDELLELIKSDDYVVTLFYNPRLPNDRQAFEIAFEVLAEAYQDVSNLKFIKVDYTRNHIQGLLYAQDYHGTTVRMYGPGLDVDDKLSQVGEAIAQYNNIMNEYYDIGDITNTDLEKQYSFLNSKVGNIGFYDSFTFVQDHFLFPLETTLHFINSNSNLNLDRSVVDQLYVNKAPSIIEQISLDLYTSIDQNFDENPKTYIRCSDPICGRMYFKILLSRKLTDLYLLPKMADLDAFDINEYDLCLHDTLLLQPSRDVMGQYLTVSSSTVSDGDNEVDN